MRPNRMVVIVVAVVLMVVVMAGAVLIALSGAARQHKYRIEELWSIPARTALSVNVTDLTGDGQRDIFVQDADTIKVLNDQQQVIYEMALEGPFATTQGDVDGDDIPDIVAYDYWPEGWARVQAFTGQGRNLWEVTLPDLGVPGRITAVDFDDDGRAELVVTDESGRTVAVSANGDTLWEGQLDVNASLRGQDDVVMARGRGVVLGDERGEVVFFDAGGRQSWSVNASGGLRRLRSFPLGGPRQGYVLVGSVSGILSAYPGALDGGQPIWEVSLGQAVNEIRPAELDGDPSTTEILAGGKAGGVWAINQQGQILWSASVGDKVTELAGVDSNKTGREEVLVGDDGGTVTIFDANGTRLTNFNVPGSVGRIEVGKLGGQLGFLVAGSSGLALYALEEQTAPVWYTPILAGILTCVVIAVVAVILGSIKPAPPVQLSAEEMTVEAQKARRRMLHESIEDLKQMQEEGQVSGEAYLGRLRQLRGQLAKVNEALITLGEPVKVETVACPHCGGTLEIGTDRCEYCGQVVIF